MKHTSKNTKPYKKSEPAESGRTRQDHTVSEPDAVPMPAPNLSPVTHEYLRQAMEIIRREIPRNTISEDKFSGAIGILDGKIEVLRAELGGEIKGLYGKIETLRAEFIGEIKGVYGKIEALDGKIEALDAKLSGKIEVQNGKIEALDSKIESMAENMVTVSDLNRQITKMTRYFIGLVLSLLGAVGGVLFWLSRFLPPYPG